MQEKPLLSSASQLMKTISRDEPSMCSYRQNEKVIVQPRDHTKVCPLEDFVHDPHDFVRASLGPPVMPSRAEYGHAQRHVRSRLVIRHEQKPERSCKKTTTYKSKH